MAVFRAIARHQQTHQTTPPPPALAPNQPNQMEVVVTDVDIPMGSLVWLLIKLGIAAVPAGVILFIIWTTLLADLIKH